MCSMCSRPLFIESFWSISFIFVMSLCKSSSVRHCFSSILSIMLWDAFNASLSFLIDLCDFLFFFFVDWDRSEIEVGDVFDSCGVVSVHTDFEADCGTILGSVGRSFSSTGMFGTGLGKVVWRFLQTTAVGGVSNCVCVPNLIWLGKF